MSTLYPVILAVPETFTVLPRPARASWLSGYARIALALAAGKNGLALPRVLTKDERGAPRPAGDIHWSLTHKQTYVAGIVNNDRIGIDVERIKAVSPGVIEKNFHPEEKRLFKAEAASSFFRCWTAKEAALKAEGSGLTGLSRCRVTSVIDNTGLVVTINSRSGDYKETWSISQYFFDGHVAAVAVAEDRPCCWTVIDGPPRAAG